MKRPSSSKPPKPSIPLASDRLWQLTADAVPALIAYVGPDLRYRLANTRYHEWLGVDPGTMPGRHIKDVIGDATWQTTKPYFDRALAGETVSYEAELAYADTKPRWVQATYTPDRDATGQIVGIAIMVRDISHRKQAEAEMQRLMLVVTEKNHRMASLVNSISDEIWYADVAGNFTLVNPAGCREFKLDTGHMPNVRELAASVEVLRPDGTPRPIEEAPNLRALRGEVVENQEELVRTPATGELRWRQVNANPVRDGLGTIIGAVAVVRDVTALKRTEERLLAGEVRFSSVLNNSTDIIYRVNLQEGRYEYISPAVMAIMGYTPEEIFALGVAAGPMLVHPDDRPMLQRAQALLEQTGKASVDYRQRTKAGDYRWLSNNMTLIRDTAGQPLYRDGNIRDITARKQAEEQARKQMTDMLRLSDQEFRTLAEAMPQIVWATRPDGWNIYFNQHWVDYTGMTLEESYGHGWNAPFHPDDKQRAWDAWQRATQHDQPYQLECRLRRHDGVYHWWLIRGEPMYGTQGEILKWFGTCTDIEHLKQNEAALWEANQFLEARVAERTAELQASEAQFRTMANAMPQLAWLGRPDGHLFWYNQRWYDYTGTTPDQMEGWGWQSVHDPVELPKVVAQWKASIETGAPFEMTFPLRGADGSFRLFLTRGFPLKDAAGRVVQWFGTNTDVTDLKRAEEERALKVEFLHLVNQSTTKRALVQAVVTFFQQQSGCAAVGIRLHDDADYPYYEARGFPAEFIQLENSLCERDAATGDVGRDAAGDPVLACMCGNVICGRFDPAKPFYTAKGSFWTNNTTELLAHSTAADRQARTRNRCNGQGYQSVALIALRSGADRLGLLQLNDPRPGRFTAATIALWERLAEYLAIALAKLAAEEQIKASLAEKEVLLKEIHHRVKNNLQVIASLVSLQADGVTDERVQAEFAEVRGRVRAMALVHEALYQAPDLAKLNFADYATRLLQQLWRAHRAPVGTVTLKLAVAPVCLPVDTAVSCGLILNELASNTLKHAFPNGRNGQVTVGLDHDPAARAACLWVQDDGIGLPTDKDWRQSPSLGLRLVQMLANQLRGTVATGPGTEFRVSFTLP